MVRSLIGVGILAALAVRLGAAPFVQGFRAVGIGSVLAALGIGALTTVCSAWRWCLVARALGLRLPAGQAVTECYRSLFLNSVLPAGVLGDVNRAVSHGRRSGDLGRGVRAVVLERAAGQVVLVAVASTVLITDPGVLVAIVHLIPRSAAAVGVTITAACAVVIGLGAAFLMTRRRTDRTAAPVPGPRRPAAHRVGTWAAVTALSAVALLGYLTTFVIAARAVGVPATVPDLLPVLVLALLAMGLPVSIGGWGPRDAVTSAAFAAVGLGAAQGLTVSVVYGALSFVACLPGAAVVWSGSRRAAHEVITCRSPSPGLEISGSPPTRSGPGR